MNFKNGYSIANARIGDEVEIDSGPHRGYTADIIGIDPTMGEVELHYWHMSEDDEGEECEQEEQTWFTCTKLILNVKRPKRNLPAWF